MVEHNLVSEFDLSDDSNKNKFISNLRRIFQSANLNFLIGSGCSYPAIKVLGDIENKITEARNSGKDEKAEYLLHDFLVPFLNNTKLLIDNDLSSIDNVVSNYYDFIGNISNILFNRKSNILPSQANIFSTNYDLFIEHTINNFSNEIVLCDGFKRTPNINNEYLFSSTEFFNTIFNNGNLYHYKVEIPSINLIKLHGSLNWQKKENDIKQDISYIKFADTCKDSKDIKVIRAFNRMFEIVLPQESKYEITTLEQIYYDLLRIFSNELDKENTCLLVEGFSFADKHILDITIRALKNKTLSLILFCYNKYDYENKKTLFGQFRNVIIIYNSKSDIDFGQFNLLLSEIKKSEVDEI